MSAETVGVVGWPRPRAACTADFERRSLAYPYPPPVRPDRPSTRPVPWVAEHLPDVDGAAWDPWEFNPDRSDRMTAEDLCQLCGEPRGAVVYALARFHRSGQTTQLAVHYGGALCSVRCARLTAAVCPHYREKWPVGVYPVMNIGRKDNVWTGDGTDDEYDVIGVEPVAVVGADS